MAFIIYCNQKGCGKDQEPSLDIETNEVICSECGKVITGITEFTKVQMKSMGQVKRNVGKRQAFSVKCQSCNKENPPLVKKGKIFCSLCSLEITDLSPFFKQALLAVNKSSA
jgi:ribosomal protein L34E